MGRNGHTMQEYANATEEFLKGLLESNYMKAYYADIKLELARRSHTELILTYREVYDMSDNAIHEVLTSDVRVSDGTLEEVGNEWDRRCKDGIYTLDPNPYGWSPPPTHS